VGGDAAAADAAPIDALICSAPFALDPTGCHAFVATPATHGEAIAGCVAIGGYLVKMDDAAESAFVGNAMLAGDPNQRVWIGLEQDSVTASIWRWLDGTIAYDGWAGGQPNNEGPYAIDHDDGTWGDKTGLEPYYYACER